MTASLEGYRVLDLAGEKGAPCVNTLAELGADVVKVELLRATPGAVRCHAPLLGQHNQYVYEELLGIAPEEVQRLEEAGVFT